MSSDTMLVWTLRMGVVIFVVGAFYILFVLDRAWPGRIGRGLVGWFRLQVKGKSDE